GPGARVSAYLNGAYLNGESNESLRCKSNLQVRDGAHATHTDAERVVAGYLYLPVFRGIRVGHWLSYGRYRQHQLWCLHHSGPSHAVAADAKHLKRFIRHLYRSEEHTSELQSREK